MTVPLSVTVPPGVEESKVRARLLEDYNLEIGAGLGALALCLGLLAAPAVAQTYSGSLEPGDSTREYAVLSGMNAPIAAGKAVAAAQAVYDS